MQGPSECDLLHDKISLLKERTIKVHDLIQKYACITNENRILNEDKSKLVASQTKTRRQLQLCLRKYCHSIKDNDILRKKVEELQSELSAQTVLVTESQAEIERLQELVKVYQTERLVFSNSDSNYLDKQVKHLVETSWTLLNNLPGPRDAFLMKAKFVRRYKDVLNDLCLDPFTNAIQTMKSEEDNISVKHMEDSHIGAIDFVKDRKDSHIGAIDFLKDRKDSHIIDIIDCVMDKEDSYIIEPIDSVESGIDLKGDDDMVSTSLPGTSPQQSNSMEWWISNPISCDTGQAGTDCSNREVPVSHKINNNGTHLEGSSGVPSVGDTSLDSREVRDAPHLLSNYGASVNAGKEVAFENGIEECKNDSEQDLSLGPNSPKKLEGLFSPVTDNRKHATEMIIVQVQDNSVFENENEDLVRLSTCEGTVRCKVDEQPAAFVDEQPAVFVDEQPAVFVDEQTAAFVDEQPAVFVDEQTAVFVDEQPAAFVDEQPAAFVDEQTAAFIDEQPAVCVDEQTAAFVDEQPVMNVNALTCDSSVRPQKSYLRVDNCPVQMNIKRGTVETLKPRGAVPDLDDKVGESQNAAHWSGVQNTLVEVDKPNDGFSKHHSDNIIINNVEMRVENDSVANLTSDSLEIEKVHRSIIKSETNVLGVEISNDSATKLQSGILQITNPSDADAESVNMATPSNGDEAFENSICKVQNLKVEEVQTLQHAGETIEPGRIIKSPVVIPAANKEDSTLCNGHGVPLDIKGPLKVQNVGYTNNNIVLDDDIENIPEEKFESIWSEIAIPQLLSPITSPKKNRHMKHNKTRRHSILEKTKEKLQNLFGEEIDAMINVVPNGDELRRDSSQVLRQDSSSLRKDYLNLWSNCERSNNKMAEDIKETPQSLHPSSTISISSMSEIEKKHYQCNVIVNREEATQWTAKPWQQQQQQHQQQHQEKVNSCGQVWKPIAFVKDQTREEEHVETETKRLSQDQSLTISTNKRNQKKQFDVMVEEEEKSPRSLKKKIQITSDSSKLFTNQNKLSIDKIDTLNKCRDIVQSTKKPRGQSLQIKFLKKKLQRYVDQKVNELSFNGLMPLSLERTSKFSKNLKQVFRKSIEPSKCRRPAKKNSWIIESCEPDETVESVANEMSSLENQSTPIRERMLPGECSVSAPRAWQVTSPNVNCQNEATQVHKHSEAGDEGSKTEKSVISGLSKSRQRKCKTLQIRGGGELLGEEKKSAKKLTSERKEKSPIIAKYRENKGNYAEQFAEEKIAKVSLKFTENPSNVIEQPSEREQTGRLKVESIESLSKHVEAEKSSSDFPTIRFVGYSDDLDVILTKVMNSWSEDGNIRKRLRSSSSELLSPSPKRRSLRFRGASRTNYKNETSDSDVNEVAEELDIRESAGILGLDSVNVASRKTLKAAEDSQAEVDVTVTLPQRKEKETVMEIKRNLTYSKFVAVTLKSKRSKLSLRSDSTDDGKENRFLIDVDPESSPKENPTKIVPKPTNNVRVRNRLRVQPDSTEDEEENRPVGELQTENSPDESVTKIVPKPTSKVRVRNRLRVQSDSTEDEEEKRPVRELQTKDSPDESVTKIVPKPTSKVRVRNRLRVQSDSTEDEEEKRPVRELQTQDSPDESVTNIVPEHTGNFETKRKVLQKFSTQNENGMSDLNKTRISMKRKKPSGQHAYSERTRLRFRNESRTMQTEVESVDDAKEIRTTLDGIQKETALGKDEECNENISSKLKTVAEIQLDIPTRSKLDVTKLDDATKKCDIRVNSEKGNTNLLKKKKKESLGRMKDPESTKRTSQFRHGNFSIEKPVSNILENHKVAKKEKKKETQQPGGSMCDFLDNIMSAMTHQTSEFRSALPKPEPPVTESDSKRSKRKNMKKNTKKKKVVTMTEKDGSFVKEEWKNEGCSQLQDTKGRQHQAGELWVRVAGQAIQKFISSNNTTLEEATKSTEECLKAVQNISADAIARAVVSIVLENVDEKLDVSFTPPAPPLTPTQHRLVTLLSVLAGRQQQHEENLSRLLFKQIRDKLLPERWFWPDDCVETSSRFFAAVARMSQNHAVVWRFCVDCLHLMPQRSCLVIYSVLQTWSNVLSDASIAGLVPKTVAHIVLQSPLPTRNLHKGRLQALKHLLQNFYHYESTPSDQYVAVLLDGFLNQGEGADALTLLVRCRKWEWSAKHVLSNLVGVVKVAAARKDPVDDLTSRTLGLVRDVAATFPPGIDEASRWIALHCISPLAELLLSSSVDHTTHEVIVDVLLSLQIHANLEIVFKNWIPKLPVSEALCQRMTEAVHRKLYRTRVASKPKPVLKTNKENEKKTKLKNMMKKKKKKKKERKSGEIIVQGEVICS